MSLLFNCVDAFCVSTFQVPNQKAQIAKFKHQDTKKYKYVKYIKEITVFVRFIQLK